MPLSYEEELKQRVVRVREELVQKLQDAKEAEMQTFKEQCEEEIEQKYAEYIQKLILDNGSFECSLKCFSLVCMSPFGLQVEAF